MKKTLLIFSQIVFCAAITSAQEVVSAQGESYSNSSGQIEFTIGELIISTFENGSNGLTQGFHQTRLIIADVKDYATYFDVSIYPNPVMTQLTIKLTEVQYGYHIDMLDINGKRVKSQPLEGQETLLDVNALATGVYMLILKDEEGQFLKTYQIHKLN